NNPIDDKEQTRHINWDLAEPDLQNSNNENIKTSPLKHWVRLKIHDGDNDQLTAVRQALSQTEEPAEKSEAVRYCIRYTFNSMNKPPGSEFNIPRDWMKLIDSYVNIPYYSQTYRIFDAHSFIGQAVCDYFDMLEKNRKSILDWGIKEHLQGLEKDVAVAFRGIQNGCRQKDISVNDLSNFALDYSLDLNEVEDILDKLVNKRLLNRIVTRRGKFYNAPVGNGS
ncbi:MAG: hypothetical protein ACXAD7_26905, partial [Candidatus Kariarchaeaceae archaeon]